MFTALPLGFLLLGLLYNALNDANKLYNNSYTNEYKLNFIEKYESYNEYLYITANSKYIFLMNKPKDEIVILPKESIHSITKQKVTKNDIGNFEAHIFLFKFTDQVRLL